MSEAILDAAHAMPPQTPQKQKLRGSDWLMLAALVTAPVFVAMAAGLGPFIILPLMDEFHASRGTVMFYLALGTVGGNLLSPFVGRALTMIPPWIVMLTGAIIGCSGLLLASMAHSLVFVALGFFAALAIGAVFCGLMSAQTIMARKYPTLMGRAVSGFVVVSGVFGVGMPLVAAPFLTEHGWRVTLATAAMIAITFSTSLIFFFLRKTGGPSTLAAPMHVQPDHAPSNPKLLGHDKAPTTLEILRSGNFWLMLIALEPLALVMGAIFPNLIPFYHDRGVELDQAKYAFSALAASALIGALLGGILVDRIGPWRYLAIISGVAFLGVGALSLDLGPPVVSLVAIVLGVAGIGAAFGVAITQLFGPAAFAPVFGLLAPFQIASAFAGALTGWGRDQLGSYEIVFGILSFILLISFIAALALMRTKRTEASSLALH